MSAFVFFSGSPPVTVLPIDQLYSPEGRKTEEKNTHINLTN